MTTLLYNLIMQNKLRLLLIVAGVLVLAFTSQVAVGICLVVLAVLLPVRGHG